MRKPRASSQPFRICPANALYHLELPSDTDPNIGEIVDVFKELTVNVAWEYEYGSLPQHVDLTKQEAVVFIR